MIRASAAILASLLLGPAGTPTAPEGEATLTFDPSAHDVRGDRSARVLVLEFSDYKCHACEKFSLTVLPALEQEFVRTGEAALAFVDFPLIDDPSYTTVAESVHCAGRQGKYWPMHEMIWQNIGALGEAHLAGYAARLGLDTAAFRACLDSDATRGRVLEGLAWADRLGLSSRPTFFVGRRDPARPGSWVGRYVVGAQSHVVFRSLIQRMKRAAGSP
jgi:protein-disulfide isomerase